MTAVKKKNFIYWRWRHLVVVCGGIVIECGRRRVKLGGRLWHQQGSASISGAARITKDQL